MIGITMQSVLRSIEKFSVSDAPVLITGESGTGKELAARTIHAGSERAPAAFIAVNCGALPANLVQSELFGHEKGAFTGANQRKIGRIEAAQNGCIFLDEIGDLATDLQVNLLRFLQEQTIERLGGITSIHVNARVIAATHRDLRCAVAEGRFREDLYYRLAVLHLHMPPLRERRDDILPLADDYFARYADKRGNVQGFSPDAREIMRAYDWPGNVRELINRVRRALVMCEGRYITAKDLGLEMGGEERPLLTLKEARAKAEQEAIEAALQHSGKNISQAARILEISRVTLYQCLTKYGMDT